MAQKRKLLDAEEAAAKLRHEEEEARELERRRLREEELANTFVPDEAVSALLSAP